MKESEIEIGKAYTVVRKDFGKLLYSRMYDGRWFLNVRVLKRLEKGDFMCSSRGEDGKPLGSIVKLNGRTEMPFTAEELEPLRK